MKEEKNSIGKTVWMEKEVIEMVKEYRKAQKEIPTFSHAINTLLKKVLTVSQKSNIKEKTESLK